MKKENRMNKKNALVATLAATLVLVGIGTGTVLAVGNREEKPTSEVQNQAVVLREAGSEAATQVKVETEVTLEEAKKVALKDAGVDAKDAKFTEGERDRDDGKKVYELEFRTEDTKYEYEIDRETGTVHSKSKETLPKKTQEPETTSQQVTEITLDKAKEIALKDAGVDAKNAKFTEGERDRDDGKKIYELELRTEDAKYEYEIDRETGKILKKDKEAIAQKAKTETKSETKASPKTETKTQNSEKIGVDQAKSIALKDAGVKAAEVTYTKAELDEDDGRLYYDVEFKTASTKYEYEIAAYTGKITEREKEAIKKKVTTTEKVTTSEPATSSLISLEEAKALAAGKAGLKVSDVTFSKAKMEKDDGKTVYEMEFYKGTMEYECEVNAETGKVTDYDAECEACDRDSCKGNH